MEKLRLFDTHTHYDDRAYGKDADALIKRLLSDNVAGFMAIGCSPARNRKALKIAQSYPGVYAAVGIHPGDVKGLPADYHVELEETAKHEKVRAIGEIGLDYHYEGYSRERQMKVFRKQLELARKLRLPVIVHSREAEADTMEILREYAPKGVVHCCSSGAETVRELAGMKILVSFTGALTFKNARRAVEACAAAPLENLMLETDCPYMAPEPHRGKLCDSSMAWHTAAKIAEIKGISTEKVVRTCNENAKIFFGIDF
ncbi:MAG: TatD family hydrolase [Oscillospiraceae bacterium]|jgi:TatD DNase family protein|nr:TatD family hydrolase [Oscillospiraceae bacterium]